MYSEDEKDYDLENEDIEEYDLENESNNESDDEDNIIKEEIIPNKKIDETNNYDYEDVKFRENNVKNIEFISENLINNSDPIKTSNKLTTYEKTVHIGLLAEIIKDEDTIYDSFEKKEKNYSKYEISEIFDMAEKEHEKKESPFLFMRYLGNNRYTIIDPDDMKN